MKSRVTIILAVAACNLSLATSVHATDYDIDFNLANVNSYESVQFKVNYTNAPGEFSGDGGSVSCMANASLNSLAAFNEASPFLKAGFIATTAFTGNIRLATCVFSSTGGAPTPAQFSITIDAYNGSTSPSVSISRIALH